MALLNWFLRIPGIDSVKPFQFEPNTNIRKINSISSNDETQEIQDKKNEDIEKKRTSG